MTNPYRDLWAELENAYQRALAALAKLEPEGPTDEEIEEWADACSEAPLEEMDPEVHGWRRCFTAKEFSETIRAARRPKPPSLKEQALALLEVEHGLNVEDLDLLRRAIEQLPN